MSKRAKPRRVVDYLTIDGLAIEAPAKPWCDCLHPTWSGSTKRADGIWVRPCCMRRTREMYDRFGDQPVPPTRKEAS